MTMLSESANADANGNATVTFSPAKSGIQWAIGQTALESSQDSDSAQAVMRVNGRLYTSAAFLPQAASGQPALMLQNADILTIDFTGLAVGESAIATIWYNESQWGTVPRVDVM